MKIRTYKQYKMLEIGEIIGMDNSGKDYRSIAKLTGRTEGSVRMILYQWNRYQQNKEVIPSLLRIFKHLEVEPEMKKEERVEREQSANAEANLERAYLVFNQSIADFIDDQVQKRTNQKLAEKEVEIAALKKKYEIELQKLQAVLIDAQNSSVIGLLKKKWSNGGN